MSESPLRPGLSPLEALLEEYKQDLAAGHARSLDVYLAKLSGSVPGLESRDAGGSQPVRAPEALEHLGPYRLLRELGRGGQGVVYLAEDVRLARHVAVKVLEGLKQSSRGPLLRFRREAEIASRLEHPGICRVYDVGVEDEVPFIAMQYLEGETMGARIAAARDASGPDASAILPLSGRDGADARTQGPAPTALRERRARLLEVVHLFERIARALHAMHEAGIVHRDVKPGNVMLTAGDEPVIMDFGLSCAEDPDLSELTRTGDVLGTPAYMSPEQILSGDRRVDARTDIWALGVMLYECVTMARPFERPTRELLALSILDEPLPDPRRKNPSVPLDLKVILETALAKEPDRRYQTALHFAEDLRRLQSHEPILAKPPSLAGRMWRWAKRRPAQAALLAVLAVAIPSIAGLSGFILAQMDNIRESRIRTHLAKIESLLEDGYYFLLQRYVHRAESLFEQAVELDPTNLQAVSGLVQCRIDAGRDLEALAALDAPSVSGVSSLDGLRCLVLRRLHRSDEAATVAARLLPPVTALENFLVGRLELGSEEEGAGERAFALFSRAVHMSRSARLLYYAQWTAAAGKVGNPELVEECAHSLLSLWPESIAALGSAAAAFHRSGQPEKGIPLLEKAIELKPDPSIHYNLGVCLADTGALEQAATEYRKALALGGDDLRCLHNLGVLLQRLGDPERALETLRRAVALAPDNAGARDALGAVLCQNRRVEEAIPHLERAVELEPDSYRGHLHLGNALRQRGDLTRAIVHYRKVVALAPAYAFGRNNLGTALIASGDFQGAREQLEEASRLAPDAELIHRNLMRALDGLSDLDAIGAELQRWTAVNPKDAGAWGRLANHLLRRTRTEDDPELLETAVAAATRAVACSVRRDARHLYTLALSLSRVEKTVEALAAVEEARGLLAEDPKADARLRGLLDRLAGRLGQGAPDR